MAARTEQLDVLDQRDVILNAVLAEQVHRHDALRAVLACRQVPAQAELLKTRRSYRSVERFVADTYDIRDDDVRYADEGHVVVLYVAQEIELVVLSEAKATELRQAMHRS